VLGRILACSALCACARSGRWPARIRFPLPLGFAELGEMLRFEPSPPHHITSKLLRRRERTRGALTLRMRRRPRRASGRCHAREARRRPARLLRHRADVPDGNGVAASAAAAAAAFAAAAA
jgi:hypothetical protein